MLFDTAKIQNIETMVSELFSSIPSSNRCAKIIHSPCFRSLFLEERTRNLIANKYIVFSIKQILESVHIKEKTNLFKKVVEKIASAALGFIPVIGSYLSVAILLAEISKEIVDEKSINDIENYLNKKWKRHKRYKSIKYIIYVDDTSSLSKQELICLQIISFLISQKYLINAAMLLAQPSDLELPYLSNCVTIKEFKAEDIIANDINKEDISVRNSLTILNIVGIDYVGKLNAVASQNTNSDKTIETIVNCILKEKNIRSSTELEKFLNSCSLLFEQFELKDVEYISNLQKNKDYQQLFTLAQKAEIIQGINLQKFYFLQPFLREFYQQRKNTFPSGFYNSVYNYLEKKYSNSYEDLAIASSILLSDDDLILSQNILAYYYSSFTMRGYKLTKISSTLESYPLGSTILNIDRLYNESDCNTNHSKTMCSIAIKELKASKITNEAKLAAMSFIVRLYYELDVEQNSLIDISKYYRSLLSSIKIFSNAFLPNWNYALDYIVFSTCIEDDYPTQIAVQKLIAAIQKTDVSRLQKEKYLKYLRLGNAIYPQSTKKAKELLLEGYEISKEYTYVHTLFEINYSATLISEGQYIKAGEILESLIKQGSKSKVINLSAQNNYSIARYLARQNDANKSIKQIYSFCNVSRQSDYCICVNNYISLKIMNGNKEFQKEIEICKEIINANDPYHSFYARHNILVIYFLTKDVKFWEYVSDFSIPYLLKHYEPIFLEKVEFFKHNFKKNWNINQLAEALAIHLKNNGFITISHFNSLPVLFGLIERWFE